MLEWAVEVIAVDFSSLDHCGNIDFRLSENHTEILSF